MRLIAQRILAKTPSRLDHHLRESGRGAEPKVIIRRATAQYRDKFTSLVHPSHLSGHSGQSTATQPPFRIPLLSPAEVPAVCGGTGSTLRPVNDGEPGDPNAETLPTSSAPGGAPKPPRFGRWKGRSRRWKVAVVVGAIVAVWAVAAVVVVGVAAERIHEGQAAVQSARRGLTADGVLSGAPVAPLHEAASSFSAAHGLLSSPFSGRWTSSRSRGVSCARSRTCREQPSRSPAPASRRSDSPGRYSVSPTRRDPTGSRRCISSPRSHRARTWPWPGSTWAPTRASSAPWRTSGPRSSTTSPRYARRWRGPPPPPPRPRRSFRDPGPTCCWPGTTQRCGRALVPSSRPGSSRRAAATSISPTWSPRRR